MTRPVKSALAAPALILLLACGPAEQPEPPVSEVLSEPTAEQVARAERLAGEFLLIDTHIDVPYRLIEDIEAGREPEDISKRTEKGDFDYPRAVAGGLNAPFMSVFTPAKLQDEGGAKEYGDKVIDLVESFEADWPDKFAVARSTEDVRRLFGEGKIALPMGMENGAPIEDDLANVAHFRDRGISYITLAHGENNLICDSSYADDETHGGLSDFGRKVVQEMNRVGILVDISHVTDKTVFHVMEVTKAPVIASHSSCRKFTPDWERNVSDEVIRAVGKNGGVIQVNFGSSFVRHDARLQSSAFWREYREYREANGLSPQDHLSEEFKKNYWKDKERIYASISDVADHIDHIRDLIGIDHIGLGSDFDGLGDSLPVGLKDVSQYHNLLAELLRRGYTEDEIRKICGENTMRVWSEAERIARKMQQEG